MKYIKDKIKDGKGVKGKAEVNISWERNFNKTKIFEQMPNERIYEICSSRVFLGGFENLRSRKVKEGQERKTRIIQSTKRSSSD